MARTRGNTVAYFPHYLSGKKMRRIRKLFGNDGYAVWFILLEILASEPDHHLELDETSLGLVMDETMVSEQKLVEIIEALVQFKEFNAYLWQKKKVLFSEPFTDSIQEVYRKRKGECVTIKEVLAFYEYTPERDPDKTEPGANLPKTSGSTAEHSGSKSESVAAGAVNKSKVNKSRVEGSKENKSKEKKESDFGENEISASSGLTEEIEIQPKKPPEVQKRKKVALKKEKSLHAKAKARFTHWHATKFPNSPDFYWSPKEIGQLTRFLKMLQHSATSKGTSWETDDEFIEKVFDIFCQRYFDSKAWFTDTFTPSAIVSNFNRIIQTLSSSRTNGSSNPKITDQYKAGILERLSRASGGC